MFDVTGAFVKRFDYVKDLAKHMLPWTTRPGPPLALSSLLRERSIPSASSTPKANRESFEGCGKACESYVSGNQITGTPSKPFDSVSSDPVAITVDSNGDIYVVNLVRWGEEARAESTSTNPAASLFAPSTAGKPPVSVNTMATAASAVPLEVSPSTR